MTTAAEPKTLSNKAIRRRLAIVSLFAIGLGAVGIGFLYLNAPVRGQTCSVEHATTQDAIGRTMACDPKVAGGRELTWQYPADTDLEVQDDRNSPPPSPQP
jgi:hypothetical protein